MATQNTMGPTFLPSRFMRYVLSERNQEELKIADRVPEIFDWKNRQINDTKKEMHRPDDWNENRQDVVWEEHWKEGERDLYAKEALSALARDKDDKGNFRFIRPTGFSINNQRYGDYPESERTAKERGWYAYINKGVPLIEERSDIVQPRPDVISEQIYVNRTDPDPMRWESSVEFSIENQINWSLEGNVELTFGDLASGTLEQAIEVMKESTTEKMVGAEVANLHSKDRTGIDTKAYTESTASETNAITSISTGSGTGEVSADLVLGLLGQVSGSLTTGWKQTSTLSGDVASRVVVRATQRRQTRRYDYTIPIVFSGYVALYYPEPVYVPLRLDPRDPKADLPIPGTEVKNPTVGYGTVGAFDISVLGLVRYNDNYDQKGWVEVASTLSGQHEAFELEELTLAGQYDRKRRSINDDKDPHHTQEFLYKY